MWFAVRRGGRPEGPGSRSCGYSESCGSAPSPTAAACAEAELVAVWTGPADDDWTVDLRKESNETGLTNGEAT